MAGLPKLKSEGKVVAHASTLPPTKRASDYDVAWVSGLEFRNSDATAAVCVTPKGRDPRTSGLHLTVDAARDVAAQLLVEAALEWGAVDVTNHAAGVEKLWQRFADQEAVYLADKIAGVSGGH